MNNKGLQHCFSSSVNLKDHLNILPILNIWIIQNIRRQRNVLFVQLYQFCYAYETNKILHNMSCFRFDSRETASNFVDHEVSWAIKLFAIMFILYHHLTSHRGTNQLTRGSVCHYSLIIQIYCLTSADCFYQTFLFSRMYRYNPAE